MDIALWIVAGLLTLLTLVAVGAVAAGRRGRSIPSSPDQPATDADLEALITHVDDLGDRGVVSDEARENLRASAERHRKRGTE